MAELTDNQILEYAQKLLKGPGEATGFRTLTQVCDELRAQHNAGIAFHVKYGERLSKLDPILERSLAMWQDFAF